MQESDRFVTCVDIDGNRKDVPVDELAFRPSIYGVIIREGKILLSRQWDGYDFPGGGVQKGERLEDALVREVYEETGLIVSAGDIVECEDSFFTTPFEKRNVHSILIYRICRVKGGELSTEYFDEDEKKYASMPEWVNLEDVSQLKFYNSIDSVEIIRKAVRVSGSSDFSG